MATARVTTPLIHNSRPYNDYGRIPYRDSEVLVCEHGQDTLYARQSLLHLGCDGEVGWLAIVYVRCWSARLILSGL